MRWPIIIPFVICSPLFALDRNGDGLDDEWQWIFSATDLSPAEDTDNDGRTNLEECRAGTNPRDSQSVFSIANYELEVARNEISIHWQTAEGKEYRVSENSNLTFNTGVTPVRGTGEMFTLTISNDGNGVITEAHGTAEQRVIDSTFSLGEALDVEEQRFFSVEVNDVDSDDDGLTDWAELYLDEFVNISASDATTNANTSDGAFLLAWYTGRSGITPEVTLLATDRCAFENNAPLAGEDNAAIRITRTGILPITIPLEDMGVENTANTSVVCNGQCCLIVGVAGDEAAERADYAFYDADGNLIPGGAINFKLGETERVITVKAVNDGIYEYPETLNVAASASSDSSYTLASTNGASLQFLDAPDEPENDVIFVGAFSQDGRATVDSIGSGFLSARLNGSRREMTITTSFSNLTSPQQDSHVHKSNIGTGATPGVIIYAITETPYDDETGPLNGPLSQYPWDITESPGATSSVGGGTSRQIIIDSLFGQNRETPLYLNIHTIENPAGEIWSFFAPTSGSQSAPGDPAEPAPAGSDDFPLLTGAALETEVRRFLDQATFGAKESEVAALVAEIETQRQGNSSYHRVEAFEAWIDEQTAMQQSYLVDYMVAEFWQQLDVGGAFDSALNPDYTSSSGEVTVTPSPPAEWPSVDRSNPDPEKWNMSAPFPFSFDEMTMFSRNDIRRPNSNNTRFAVFTLYNQAKDQLRLKLGYSLQQILLVSNEGGELRNQYLAYANYQDMLNTYGFGTYRDLLGYVNGSPIMGNWLTSLRNQREADLDGDGVADVFADENLARENMQLFSVGLFERWEDGSLRLDASGNPIPTYTNDDIRELAKIITGQSYGKNNNSSADDSMNEWGGKPFDQLLDNTDFFSSFDQGDFNDIAYYYPMAMFPDFHDESETKTIIGGKEITNYDAESVAAATTPEARQALALKDLDDAMDWLAGKPGDGRPDFDGVNSHGSTPAFVCRRLIQRFVTSNPSQDYLHRVSRAFIDNEGGMKETIKAILLDPAARVFDVNDNTFGMKKNPIEAYIQTTRKLSAVTGIPITPADTSKYPFNVLLGDYSASSNPRLYLGTYAYPSHQLSNFTGNYRQIQANTIGFGSSGLQIALNRQDTVFNWYLPDFSPSGVIAEAGLVAPEIQLVTDTSVMRNINYFQNLARSYTLLTDDRLRGVGGQGLAGGTSNQRRAFGLDPDTGTNADWNDNTQLSMTQLAEAYYPQEEIFDTNDRTGESIGDEALVDALDNILTYGALKSKYPYDPSDDDDPSTPEIDDSLKNPRECIIDAIGFYNNPWPAPPSSGLDAQLRKVGSAIWLITFTPEFNIRK